MYASCFATNRCIVKGLARLETVMTADAVRNARRLAFVSLTSTLDNDYYVQLSNKTGATVLEADDLVVSRKGFATG
jgi:hypothetical protein